MVREGFFLLYFYFFHFSPVLPVALPPVPDGAAVPAVPTLTSLPSPRPARTCERAGKPGRFAGVPSEGARPPGAGWPRWDGSPASRASLQIDFSAGLLAGGGWQPAEDFARLFKGFSCSAPGLLESPEEGLLSRPCLS